MMKWRSRWVLYCVCVLALLIPFTSKAQTLKAIMHWGTITPMKDHILYDSATVIQIKDFKSAPDNESTALAMTKSGISFSMQLKREQGIYKLHVYVAALFDKKGSWFKSTKYNERVLSHEQKHFEITAYIAYQLMEALQNEKVTVQNYQRKLQDLYDDAIVDWNQQQNLYDRETEHGSNVEAQAAWHDKVTSKLKKVLYDLYRTTP